MLLRNLDQFEGLCNGTRMIGNRLATYVIEAKEKCWEYLLHSTNEFVSIPFTIALQINKDTIFVDCFICYDNQQVIRQSLASVGLYLSRLVFSHGQQYVSFSRVQSMEELNILIHDKEGKTINTTINVVFKKVFQNL
ncbi:hypothetical protein Lal_00018813 [Lupinus albus]|nr:hypothetical protein Lal_00018813 [Lupinus albus]